MLTFPEFEQLFPELCHQRVRVMVADDSLQGRQGLSALLKQPPVIAVVGSTPSAEELFAVCEEKAPDVVVLDLCLPGVEAGLSICSRLKKWRPNLRVLVVTGHEILRARQQAQAAGADGFALKRFSDGVLWKCVLEVASGRPAFPSYKRGWLAEDLTDEGRLGLLSADETEVLKALAHLTNATPVQDYGVIKALIRAHGSNRKLGNEPHIRKVLERVRDKLGMKSLDAARWYQRAVIPLSSQRDEYRRSNGEARERL